MACYKSGGCGVYEMYSCSECPASKPEYVEEIKKTGIIGKWEGVPVASIPDLITWLLGQKYTNIDETNVNMTEKFEMDHQWELSRNTFINEVIRHLEQPNK